MAVVFFHLGFKYAAGASARVNDIVFSQVDGASRMTLYTNQTPKFKLSLGEERKKLTIRLISTEAGDIFRDITHSDDVIESFSVVPDENTGDTLVTITFKNPGVSFYKTTPPIGDGLIFDFRPSKKTLRIAGVTPEKLLGKRPEEKKERPPKEETAAVTEQKETPAIAEEEEASAKERLAALEQKYYTLEHEAGRADFIKMMKALQKQKFEDALRLANQFIQDHPKSMYLEKVYFSAADALYQMAKRNPAYLKPAMEAYNTATARFPESRFVQQAMMRRADLYRMDEFYIEALSEYGGLLKMAPKSKYAVPAMLGRARIFLDQKKYQKAYNELERILVLYPARPEVRDVKYMIAESYYERGKFDVANNVFEEALKLWPTYPKTHPITYMKIAETHYMLGKYPKAMEDWASIVNLFPVSFEGRRALLRIGDMYMELGRKKMAAKVYENAARRFEDSDEAILAKLALASLGAEDPEILKRSMVFDYTAFEDPLKTFDEILAKSPKKHGQDALMRKGRALSSRKRYVSAILAYKQLLRSYPSTRMSEEVFSLVRQNFIKLIDTFHAQDGFFTVLMTYYDNFDPFLRKIENPDILLKIADSYKAMTLYDRAIEYYRLVNARDEKGRLRPVTSLNIATAELEKETDPKEAERMLRLFIKEYPRGRKTPLALSMLGDALMAQGREAEAATQWLLSLEMSPAGPGVSETYYKLAGVRKKKGEYILAVDAFRRAIASYKPRGRLETTPEFIKDSYYQIAEAHYLEGDYPSAIKAADSFASRYPDDPRTGWMEYIVSAALGRIDKDDAALPRLKALAEKEKENPIGKVAAARLMTLEWKRRNAGLFLE